MSCACPSKNWRCRRRRACWTSYHAVNHHVFDAMKYRAPYFDQAVAALIEDLHERGLDQRVLLVVGGDFGRTPRISYVASSGGGAASGAAGVVQPGRDHWPHAMSFLFSGAGVAEGQVIGATDRLGEHPTERRVGVGVFRQRSTGTWALMPSAPPSATQRASRSPCCNKAALRSES
jgi:hypothetical protein